ncbi:MAG: threonine/homoserine/homoserine lactone efflux protein [Gammaproteobacteria bacterium]|jgi:threonine/homoserine/homoserine lactone efflux protein
MLSFTIAVLILVITPGPAVLSIAGVGAAFGFRVGIGYVLGVVLGANLVAVFVISGLAAVLFSFPELRIILMSVSLCYLIFLAARIAFAGSKLGFTKVVKPPGIWSGIIIQTINPKAYVVMVALFSGFPFLPENVLAETTIKFTIANFFWIPAHLIWLYFGVAINQLNLSDNAAWSVNIAMALAMLGVVAVTVLSAS